MLEGRIWVDYCQVGVLQGEREGGSSIYPARSSTSPEIWASLS